ncbi:MAG: class I SAM-dependent methyltransferase [Planctomycetota bacterium]
MANTGKQNEGGDWLAWNRTAWDRQVDRGNRWTVPVDDEAVERARAGDWSIVLTPAKPVPRSWFPTSLEGVEILALASGGGQQATVLAAAGANVTLLDNSPRQIEQDRKLCERHGLEIRAEQGDMRDLSRFEQGQFDLCVHPSSNTFVPDPEPVWNEAARVLRPGSVLMSGFLQPAFWIFDEDKALKGELVVRHSIPYADEEALTPEELKKLRDEDEPLCFGHSFDSLLGGQCRAGFVIEDMFEDEMDERPLDRHLPSMMATKSRLRANQP